jgi:ribose transport system permease protein
MTETRSTDEATLSHGVKDPRVRAARSVPFASLALPLLLLAILALGAILTHDFMTVSNVRSIMLDASITGIVAVMMTTVTLSGNFVSLASSASTVLAAILFVELIAHGWNLWLAIAVVVASLLIVGLVQGLIVGAGLNPIITTLAAAAIITGFVEQATNSRTVNFGNFRSFWLETAAPLGVPLPIWVFVILTGLLAFLVHATVVGRKILLVGSNRETAGISGISIRGVTLITFAVMSVGFAVAGILAASEVGSASAMAFPDLTVDAIAAVLVGGSAIQGGSGSPVRSAIGAVLISALNNLMVLDNFSNGVQMTVDGACVLAVVLTLNAVRRRAGSR